MKVTSGLPALVGAAVAVAIGGHGVWEGLASHGWPTAPGIVIGSRVVEEDERDGSGGSAHVFEARVAYAYTAGGRARTGQRVETGLAGSLWQWESAARATGARYPRGAAVTVAYDAGNPDRAVLEPGVTAASGAFLLVGAGTLLVGVLTSRPRARAAGLEDAGA